MFSSSLAHATAVLSLIASAYTFDINAKTNVAIYYVWQLEVLWHVLTN